MDHQNLAVVLAFILTFLFFWSVFSCDASVSLIIVQGLNLLAEGWNSLLDIHWLYSSKIYNTQMSHELILFFVWVYLHFYLILIDLIYSGCFDQDLFCLDWDQLVDW